MTYNKKGISALVVTCAFAMFAIAAIPTHATASSYYNGIDVSLCTDVFCGDFYNYGDVYGGSVYLDGVDFGFHYGQPETYSYPVYTYPTYSYPEYYTYPTVYTYTTPTYPRRTNTYVPYPFTPAQDFALGTRQFNNDFARAAAEWNAYANHYATWPL